MSRLIVTCEGDWCDEENEDYEESNGTYWFTCAKCGYENEVVYAGWK